MISILGECREDTHDYASPSHPILILIFVAVCLPSHRLFATTIISIHFWYLFWTLSPLLPAVPTFKVVSFIPLLYILYNLGLLMNLFFNFKFFVFLKENPIL